MSEKSKKPSSEPEKDHAYNPKKFWEDLVNGASTTVSEVLNNKGEAAKGEIRPDPADLSQEVGSFADWLRHKNKGPVTVELIPLKENDADQVVSVVSLQESGLLGQNYLLAFGSVADETLTSLLQELGTASKEVKYAGIALLAQSWPPTRFDLEKEISLLVRADRVRLGKDTAAADYLNDWLAEYSKSARFDKKELIKANPSETTQQGSKGGLFIGREEPLAVLTGKILSTSPTDAATNPAWIFSIAGEGGIGKSYLLKQVQARCGPRMVYASLDHTDLDKEQAVEESENGLIGLMSGLARRLRENGCRTPHFEELHKKYLTAQNRLTKPTDNTTETLKGVREALGGTDAKSFSKAAAKQFRKLEFLKFVPGVINITGTIAEVGFGIYDRYSRDEQLKADAILNQEAVEDLTAALVQDLAKFVGEERKKYYLWRRPVLVLDTYELIGPLANQWLRTRLIKSPVFRKLEPVVIVAGRYDLTHLDTRWTELQPEVQVLRLTPFDREATTLYLQKLQGGKPQKAAQIYKLAGGSPLFLNLVATTNSEEEAVRRLKERILEEFEPTWHNLFVEMAVPDGFNLETIQRLLKLEGKADSDDSAREIYNYLQQASFVEGRGGRLHYLPGVRRVLMRYGELESPTKVAQIRAALEA